MNEPTSGQPDSARGSILTRLLFWALPVFWLLVLAGFVTLPFWIVLSIAGPLLLRGGFSLTRDALPHLSEGIAYIGAFVVGALLVIGSLATLMPGMPASWLTGTAAGLSQLDMRNIRLKKAIGDGDAGLAGRLAARGLGTDIPIDKFGRPLLFAATDTALLEPLLKAGLSPDVVDGDGRSFLMLTHDAGIAGLLLNAGADTEIRDAEGRTALFYAAREGVDHVQPLLEAGADVHAADHAGFIVSDVYPASGPLRQLLEAHAGGMILPQPREVQPTDLGRRDWLLGGAQSLQSEVRMTPEKLKYGEAARLDIRIVNDRTEDRLLQVHAILNSAAYLVSATHDGRAENPGLAMPWRSVRWPLLTLPADTEGALTLNIVARGDPDAGDIGVDVFYRDVGATEDTVMGISQSLDTPDYDAESGLWTMVFLTLVGGLAVIYASGRWMLKKRDRSAGVRAATLGAIVSFSVVLVMAQGMVEPWFAMEQTQCEILDRRVRIKIMKPSSFGGTTGQLSSGNKTYAVPMLAVRYSVAGDHWISTGFNASMANRSISELRHFKIGDSVPCWFDPDQPARFTVALNPGAAGIAGLIMALLCGLVFSWIALMLRRQSS